MISKTASEQSVDTARATMRAARVVAPGQVVVEQVARPEPGPGQVRVRLEGCGVCASNIPPFEGREWFEYPLAPGGLGHEGWGHVDALGDGVAGVKEGDRVAFISDHAYAEYDLVDASGLVALPAQVADQPVPGEPLGCAVNICRRADVKPGQTVAIIGVGFLGALLTQLVSQAGAKVIAIGRRAFALELARESGASWAVAMDDHWRVIEQVRQLTDEAMCDTVIECVGQQWPLDLASELVKVRGRLVVAGYHQDGPRQVNMQSWNWRGLDVINAHERDPAIYTRGIREAVDALAEGRLQPGPLYTHTYRLEQLGEALTAARDRPPGFMKALIAMTPATQNDIRR